jgi:hypothetical protein
MLHPERLFENPFSDKRIINVRLANFANDCLNRLTNNNSGGSYTDLINLLTPTAQALDNELGQVATALSMQKSKTSTVNNVIDDFRKRMSDLNGVIAHKLGGFDKPAFLEFYPQGITEYSKASKPKMPILMKRIKTAATAHAATLGADIATELQAFEPAFENARNSQQQTKGSVDENRSDRSAARRNVEEALVKIVHNIAERFPGNVQQCMSFFDFSLLNGKSRKKDEDDATADAPTPAS